MKKIAGLIVVIVLSFFMVRPLLGDGYFPVHDDTQIARVVVMGHALRQGQFPVRWVSDLGYGYGYPIFNFYGPLPYYVGGALSAAGASGIVATKFMMGLGLVLSGIFMYVAIADILGISAGILAATLYMYAPYHAVQAYVRGSVGEYWTLAFLPLIFWGLAKIHLNKQTSGVLIGAFGLAGLILSHTILGYVGGMFVGIYSIIVAFRGKRTALMLTLLGFGLSAFFWLPAISEMKYTNVASQVSATSYYHDHFVCLPQLWESPWGFGGSVVGCLDGLSFKLGKIHIVLAGLAMVLGLYFQIFRKKLMRATSMFGCIVFVLSVFFLLPISEPFWGIIPNFPFIQYPWRFLTFGIFGLSLVGATVVSYIPRSVYRGLIVILLVGLVIYVEGKRFAPQFSYKPLPLEFEQISDIQYRASKISDEYLPADVPRPLDVKDTVRDTIVPSGAYTLEVMFESDTYGKYGFHALDATRVVIHKAYFPGWKYWVNSVEQKPIIEHGLPSILIPKGESVAEIRFENTPVRTIGNVISLLSLGVLIYLYDRKNKKTIS